MCLHGIKLITFDATNTLLKFRVPPWQVYTNIARDYGFVDNEKIIKTCFIESYKCMWNKYPNFGKHQINWKEWWTEVIRMTFEGKLPASTNVDVMANNLINEFRSSKCWHITPGGDQLLKVIKSRVNTLGVISNFDPRLNDILKDLGVHDCFDFIATSYHVGYCKPDKRIFMHALELCKTLVKPSEALHIGDDQSNDYEGAKSSGWHAILVSASDKTTNSSTNIVFNNLEDLCLAIEQNKLKLL